MAKRSHTPTRSEAHFEGRRWLFADAVLDESSRELSVAGNRVDLEHKPFDVLRYLLQHAGEVVTKDELLSGVWPGRVLSDTVLAKSIGRLRKVLGDTNESVIKTVHRYGYRLVSAVRVEVKIAPEPTRFDFRSGDRPLGRPMWSLVRRLGAGGHGEAWLAQHDKTHEQRVFKFAVDEPSLAALKREVTLFRFLSDSLGPNARIVSIKDWNFEQPPCFIESTYIAGGSLLDWSERSGGLDSVPLAVRIDVAAQIAEALGAVHSVGALHKDLKPSNVLVDAGASTTPSIRLADFGSGGMLDPKKLEALGITRLGFTKTLTALNATSGGTPLYLAPEVLAGQPPTVKADMYALGVVLYQLIVGNFRKAMSQGWERDVADPLLCECIADAAQGDTERRLGDAAMLALRLRSLDEERERRRRERTTREKAEAVERAEAAAATSRAVANFLSKDMFAVVGAKPLRDLTVRELLDAASAKLADRFQDMPLAAAQIHSALGHAFFTMQALDAAEKHFEEAVAIYEQLEGPISIDIVSNAARLVSAKTVLGKFDVLPRFRLMLRQAQSQLGNEGAVLDLMHALATAALVRGYWREASDHFGELVEISLLSGDAVKAGHAQTYLAFCFMRLGEFEQAFAAITEAKDRLRGALGSSHMSVALAQELRGRVLAELSRFEEAESELSTSLQIIRAWSPEDRSPQVLSGELNLGLLRLRQSRFEDAIGLLQRVVEGIGSWGWSAQRDESAEARMLLADALLGSGRRREAEDQMLIAHDVALRAHGSQHPLLQQIRLGLARIHRESGRDGSARAFLTSIDKDVLQQLRAGHPLLAELRRLERDSRSRKGPTSPG